MNHRRWYALLFHMYPYEDGMVGSGLGLHGIGAWAPFGRVIGISGHNGSTGRGLQGIGQRKGRLHKGVSGQTGSSELVSTTESTRAIITKTTEITHKTKYNFILPKFIANQSTVSAHWMISRKMVSFDEFKLKSVKVLHSCSFYSKTFGELVRFVMPMF